jgi:hypothetical protein
MIYLVFVFSLVAFVISLKANARTEDLEQNLKDMGEELARFKAMFAKLHKEKEPASEPPAQESVLATKVEQESVEELVPEAPDTVTLQTETVSEEMPESVETPESLFVRFISACKRKWAEFGPQYREGEAKEIVLMRWWLPRIGGALALLTLLFLGLYMSQFSSPWMRACELIGISLAFCGLGLFFERRQKSFGSVVFVTGLIMLYLTSYAIYAFPAVMIIQNPMVGALLQLAVMVLICVVGLVRRNNGLIYLSYVFGFIIVLFMQHEVLMGGALYMALVLAFSAFALWGIYKRLAYLAYVGHFILILSQLSSFVFGTSGLIYTINPYLALVVALVSTLAIPLLVSFGGGQRIPYERRFLLLGMSSGSGIGYLFLRYSSPIYWDTLLIYYAILAVLFVVLTSLNWRKKGFKFETQWFLVFASIFTTLWVQNYYAGDIRWYALIIESLVIALINRRNRTWVNEIAMYALWLNSTVLMCASMVEFSRSETWMPVQSFLYMLYPIFQIAVPVVAYGREPKWKVYSKIISAFVGVFSAVFFIAMSSEVIPFFNECEIVWFIGSAYLFGLIALLPKLNRSAPIVASVFLYVCSIPCYFSSPGFEWVLLLMWGWACLAAYTNSRREKFLQVWSYLAYLGSVFVTAHTLNAFYLADSNALLCSMILALAALGVSRYRLLVPLFLLSLLFPVYAILSHLDVYFGRSYLELTGLLCHVGAILLMVGWLLWAKRSNRLSQLWTFVVYVFLAFLYYIKPMEWSYWWGWQLFMLASLLCFFFYSRVRQEREALLPFYLLVVLQLVSVWAYTCMYTLYDVIPGVHFMVMELLYAAVYFLCGLILNKSAIWKPKEIGISQGALAIAAYLTGVAVIFYPALNFATFYTPLLGVLSVLFVVVGVLQNIRVYRLLGLITLIVPGYRLFVYDITDALYRILAFGVGALLLIFIGYLYHRIVITADKSETDVEDTE